MLVYTTKISRHDGLAGGKRHDRCPRCVLGGLQRGLLSRTLPSQMSMRRHMVTVEKLRSMKKVKFSSAILDNLAWHCIKVRLSVLRSHNFHYKTVFSRTVFRAVCPMQTFHIRTSFDFHSAVSPLSLYPLPWIACSIFTQEMPILPLGLVVLP